MTKNRLLLFLCAPILVVCFALSFAFSGALAFLNFDNHYASGAGEKLDGVGVYGDAGYVSVSELYNYSGESDFERKFTAQNLKSLLSLVLGEEYTGIDQLKEAGTKTSKEMIDSTYGKEEQALPIQVRFGGLYWDVVYLSEDVNGDPILTLWLRGGKQTSSWSNYTAGRNYGFFDGILYSDWAANFSGTNDNPANMYSTSYIRCVTLNNGGQYFTSNGSLTNASQSKDSVFYMFTAPKDANKGLVTYTVNRFLVQPKDVSWQISGQSVKTKFEKSYDAPNENCTNTEQSDWATDVDYTQKAKYYDWGNDYLWLPSLSEVGSDESHPGLWEVSTAQKKNSDKDCVKITDNDPRKNPHVGSDNYDVYGYNGTWLRSGAEEAGNLKNSYYITYDGINACYDGQVRVAEEGIPTHLECSVNYPLTVRPAIHLNLIKAIEDAGLDRIEINIDKSSSSGYEFNETNVHEVYNILGGKENTTYKEITELAKSTLTSEDILSKTYNKNAGQYLTIRLGGLVWDAVYLSTNTEGEPILTLWLNSSKNFETSNGPRGTQSERNTTYGTFVSKWSYDWGDIGDGTLNYPSNMYGTSYIRAVALNNGGSYATGYYKHEADEVGLISDSQVNNSAFTIFTVSTASTSLTKFLEQPKNIPWQISGQSTLPNEYCASGEESGASLDYTGKDKYYAWAEDYLWLPSLSEVGYDASHTGIWKTSVYQRYNHLGFDGQIDRSAGSSYNSGVVKTEGYYFYDRTLLRSGKEDDSSQVYYLSASGNGASTDKVYEKCALRPALHLNLKKVATEINDLIELKTNNIILTQSSEVYTGEPITLEVTYQKFSFTNKVKLTENEDYTIVYGDNVNAGKATCTITGINDYTGVVETWFLIEEYTLTEDDIELIPPENLVYTGDPITAAGVKIKSLNRILKLDEDYEIEYDGNVNANYVGCTIKGKGNYKGIVEDKGRRKFYFEIEKKELTIDMIQVVEEDHFVDVDVRIQFSLVYNGKTLKEGTDYTFKYSENNRVTKAAKLTITAADSPWCNFKGSFTYEFEIKDPNAVPEPEPEPTPGPSDSGNTDSKPKSSVNVAAIIVPIVIVLGGIAGAAVYFIKKKKK